MADERVEVRATACPWDRELSLKTGEPQVGQRHEEVKRKLEYYHIATSHQVKRGQVKENLSDGTL